jgi:hypothetical protein
MKIRQGIFSGKGFFPIGFAGLFLAAIFSLTVTACGGDDTTPTADPALTGSVSISGITRVGETLTAQINTLEGTGTISYQWNRGDMATTVNNPISGATDQTYRLDEADLGKYVTVTVSRAGYTGTKTSNIAGPVVGAGEPDPTPTVTSVIVSPATARVAKGGTQRFSATVNGNYNPAQTVTWSVTGGITGTAISSEGLLTVAAAETATTLTVRAASTVNPAQSGTAAVTVTGGGGGGDNPAPPQPVSGATIYTLSGTTFTPYTGTGSPQTVMVKMRETEQPQLQPFDLGDYATISAEGKLTLNLPDTVPDNKLFDFVDDCKTGLLITSPNLELYRSDGSARIDIIYANKSGSITTDDHTLSWEAGWNYFSHNTPVNNISDCKWVIIVDNPAPAQPVSGATIYTRSGTTFTPYTGTGSPQTVTAELSFFDSSSYSNSLGSSIGTISADGKLTLNLPTTVEDSKLWDCPSEYSDYFTTDPVGIKLGRLQILSRSLKLYTSDGEEVRIEYYNRTGTITLEEHGETRSLSVTAGWNYFRQLTPVNNISDCKWVAMH